MHLTSVESRRVKTQPHQLTPSHLQPSPLQRVTTPPHHTQPSSLPNNPNNHPENGRPIRKASRRPTSGRHSPRDIHSFGKFIFLPPSFVLTKTSQNCHLDRRTLSICISMIENGVNPEALAASLFTSYPSKLTYTNTDKPKTGGSQGTQNRRPKRAIRGCCSCWGEPEEMTELPEGGLCVEISK